MKSSFITFEGIDGSGKSTQIRKLSSWLNEQSRDCILVREPGGTDVSESIRDLLLNVKKRVSPYCETLLFMAARAQLAEEIIWPSLKENKFVLCDRFIDSTIAYQGYGRNMDLKLIESLHCFSTQNLIPDITFLIDIDVETSIKRRKSKVKDRMETEGFDFLEKVRFGYKEIAKLSKSRYHIISGDQTENNIFEQVKLLVKNIKE